jgi:type II secretory pathway component GspD/PulD (secretin)
LYGPDGKLAENFKPESAFILNTAQQYILVSRQDGAAADAWQICRGPFTLDLTCPGQYTLTIPASPTAASETRNVQLNFTKREETRNLLPTALQQYVGIPPAASADANSRTLTITAPPAIGDGIVAELKTTDVRPRRVALDFSIIQAEPQTLADLGIEWTSDGNHPSSASTGDIRIGRIDNRMSSDSWRAKLKLLEEDSRLDILAKPQVAGQDGKTLSLKVQSRSHSEWFPSGETSREIALWITPSIGDYNDVTLRIAVDVNDSYEPRNRDQSSSRISQDTSYAVMVIRDGDTAVLTGLKAESYAMKPRSVAWLDQLPIIGAVFGNNPPTQETAFFVTLHLLPDAASIDD